VSSTATNDGLRSVQDRLPFDFFERLQAEGEVIWDSGMNAWLATSYDACREVGRLDKNVFRHTDFDPNSDFGEMSAGRRSIKALEGEEHRRVHSWMIRSFTPTKTAHMRDVIVEPVVDELLGDIAGRERVELTSELLHLIPPRVIASALDLPWRDRAWMDEGARAIAEVFGFYNLRGLEDREHLEVAKAAHARLRQILDPFLQERRDGTGDDLISQLWHDGPEMLDGWNIEDVYIQLSSLFLGGSHTTTLALSNAFYLLLNDDALMQDVRTADDARLYNFVDQALRVLPPLHWRTRVALEDVEIAGVTIKAGDVVVPLLAAANHDAGHYACPHAVDLEQKNPRDHMTFFAGPTACPGQGLARTEMFVTLRKMLATYPTLRLDPEADPPAFAGLALRGFLPLNVLTS